MYVASLFFHVCYREAALKFCCLLLIAGFWEGLFFLFECVFNCVSLLLFPMVFNSSFRNKVSAMEDSDDIHVPVFSASKREIKKVGFHMEWKVMLLLF